MNKKNGTRVDLKHLPSKKQIGKEKVKEQVIYSEVKISTPNANQTKKKRTTSSKGKVSSVPFTWRLTVVILGILCFFLLLTTGTLGLMALQGHQEGQPQKAPLDNVAKEDNSGFKTITCKKEPPNTGSKCSTCEGKWSCCGEQCYYFSNESKTFEDSKKSCKEMVSTLLKIDNEKERQFIQRQLSYFSWIGLSRKGTSSPWAWEDGSEPFLKMLSDWQESENGNCARMSASKVGPYDCSRLLQYVCEKQIAFLATW